MLHLPSGARSRAALAVLAAGLGSAALAAPAPAATAVKTRVVLAVNARTHVLEVVNPADRRHAAALVRYRGRIAGKVRVGSRITYVVKGKGRAAHAEKVRVVRARVARLTVRGRIVRVGGATGIRLADGRTLRIGAAGVHKGVSLVLQGFEPGQSVEVTIGLDANGDQQITVRMVHGESTAARAGDPISVEGDVTRISFPQGAFLVLGSDGRSYAFAAGTGVLNSIAVDDHVVVVGHYTPDLTPKADFVDDQTQDAATGGQGDSYDVYGTVVDVNVDEGTISVDEGDGGDPTVLAADADLLDAVAPGDCVHVTAYLDDNGDPVAEDVEQSDEACAGGSGQGADVDMVGVVEDVWTNDDGSAELVVSDQYGRTVDFHGAEGDFDAFTYGDCVHVGGTLQADSDTDADLAWVEAADSCAVEDGNG